MHKQSLVFDAQGVGIPTALILCTHQIPPVGDADEAGPDVVRDPMPPTIQRSKSQVNEIVVPEVPFFLPPDLAIHIDHRH